MRLTLRRLSAAELDPELVAFAVLAASGAFATAWLALKLPTPVCVFHQLTGLPCLTCGGTRCMKNLLAGHVGTALGWNPLVFIFFVAAGVFLIYAAAVTALRLPRIRVDSVTPREANILRLVIVLVAAANWIYEIYRFSRGA